MQAKYLWEKFVDDIQLSEISLWIRLATKIMKLDQPQFFYSHIRTVMPTVHYIHRGPPYIL